MVTKWNISCLKLMYKKGLRLSKGEFTRERGVGSMAIRDSFPMKNFIVLVIHLQIGIGNDVLKNILYLIDSDE